MRGWPALSRAARSTLMACSGQKACADHTVALALILAYATGSSSSAMIAAASARALPSVGRMPVIPSTKASADPPLAGATTGTPASWASASARPKPSPVG